jgi:hypothetical protein
MSLKAGVRLGQCEILAAIGAGGVGEVYRARDSKLDRVSSSNSPATREALEDVGAMALGEIRLSRRAGPHQMANPSAGLASPRVWSLRRTRQFAVQ